MPRSRDFFTNCRVEIIVEFGRNGSQVVVVLFVFNAEIGREPRTHSLDVTGDTELLKQGVEFIVELGRKSVQRFVEFRSPSSFSGILLTP